MVLAALLITSPVKALGEERVAPGSGTAQAGVSSKPADTAKKVSVKKKRLKRHKAAAEGPGTGYKFSAQDSTPAYRFDKEGNPILKKASVGAAPQKTKKAGAGTTRAATPLPKLNATSPGRSARKYVCPMGDFEGDKPGQCPKCGMTLVEKQ